MTILQKLLLGLLISLLGLPIAVFAGLDDRRHLPRDGPKTREQFKQSLTLAKKGDPYAQYLVCAGYYAGKVVKKNYSKALSWCTLAAHQGVKQAQYWLGYFYFDDVVTTRDYEQAVYWFQLSAEQNYRQAQYKLALMYEGGRGIDKNHEKAVYWYQLSAKQEYPPAQKALDRYRIFEEKLNQARRGDSEALKHLCYECLVGNIAHEQCKQTLLWCTRAVNEGSAPYQSYLGELYLNGRLYRYGYQTEKDYEKALHWFQAAIKQYPSDKRSSYLLGTMYENGIGVEKNHDKAIYYYQMASQRGFLPAERALKRIRKQSFFSRLKNLFGSDKPIKDTSSNP